MPVRLVHWLMVLTVAAAWWTAETGRMSWHQYCGFTLLALLTFRIYWGFFGSSTARFGQFVRGPRAVIDYLKGTWAQAPGHNPLGALSVVALLALMLTQVVLGLFTVDVDGIESGPLSTYVSFDAGRLAADWHDKLFDALLWLIGLHIAAVVFYLLRKQNLIGAMFTGMRAHDGDQPPVVNASVLRFIVGVVLAGILTWMASRAFQFS
ncbi:MAG TPA: cytochrome b/b6 domain-containing protein [Steroidobacteraceae bacterium]|nr:cytochrome b/b6 domain-containing protein [Steroidobacteraceae bacterium]